MGVKGSGGTFQFRFQHQFQVLGWGAVGGTSHTTKQFFKTGWVPALLCSQLCCFSRSRSRVSGPKASWEIPWRRTRGSLRSSSCLGRKPPRAPQLEGTTWEAWELQLAFSYRNTVIQMGGLTQERLRLRGRL